MTFSRLLISFLISLCLCFQAFSAEVLESFDERSLPVLNDELRKIAADVRDALITDLTSEIEGVLPLVSGGTGSALVDPGADRLGFWDDSEGEFTWLSLGDYISITGTTVNVSPPSAALTYKGTDNFDGEQYSSNISISGVAGSVIHVFGRLQSHDDSAGSSTTGIQLNNISSGYKNYCTCYNITDNAPADLEQDAFIAPCPVLASPYESDWVDISATIFINGTGDAVCQSSCKTTDSSDKEWICACSGYYTSATAISSVRLYTSAQTVLSGDIWVYEATP